jgi:hypothetical protein
MDFDWVSCGYAKLWNTQTALRIPCLFLLQSKSIYPSPTGYVYEESSLMSITRLITECS